MSEKQKKRKKLKKKKKPLRDKIDRDAEISLLLADMELELYYQCMRLDKKRKRKHYIV